MKKPYIGKEIQKNPRRELQMLTTKSNSQHYRNLEAEILEREAKAEGIGKTVFARLLLLKALREHRVNKAIEEYINGKCSVGYAATRAGVLIRDLLNELIKRGYFLRYDEEDAIKDLENAEENGKKIQCCCKLYSINILK